ncbi:MAG: molybdate ABC transporter substrate-binding protein [Desulfobacteraceae bacterium]|jgi:molybdate transport system substrate-binding protein
MSCLPQTKIRLHLKTAGFLAALAAVVLFSTLPAAAEELTFFAGAGLRQPTDVLVARFESQTGHHVFTSYDGSGRLLARIQASGRGDLFMPGALFFIDRLREAGSIRTMHPLVAHTAVVGVALHAKERIQTFKDLAKPGIRLALGDPKAMAFGRTARAMIQRAGMETEILENVVVYGGTVKQLALYVARGEVDASIIGRADAFQYSDRIHRIPIPKAYFEPETIAVAVLESTRHPDIAARFCEFMASDEALAVFREFGFLPLEE